MTDINNLCELVNTKYNLRPNQIGSIEYHSDMCENSIVQICNQYRGTRRVLSGDNTVLADYLQLILNDKITLNFWKLNL